MPRIAIMQPYIFPYIGYFQLIKAVDVFVFYNDVNFIKKGWIHRNRILVNGGDFLFTIPCADASQNKRICDVKITFDEKERNKLLTTITQAYKKAPMFGTVYPHVEKVLSQHYETIDEIAIASVTEVCSYLDLQCQFLESKQRYNNEALKRADRLIDICQKEKIADYINPIGGIEIYTKEYFQKNEINLSFLKTNMDVYDQQNSNFIPWLSVIDIMMFNDRDKIAGYLQNFELI